MQIQYNDPNSTYWKDKYKTLPNEVGPYAENKEKSPAWMRSKGLRYGGQDGGGHFWVSKSGDIYYFDDVAPGSSNDTDNTNSNDAGTSSIYTPSGNNVLNTNAVTAPLQPIIYWPNNINSADITPRANPGSGGNYLPGHIANSSGITGKFGIIDKGGVTNYDFVPMGQVNSTTNEPMSYLDRNKYMPISDSSEEGCDRKSHFYIIPLTEKNKDDVSAAEEFFGYMNDRAGGIFKRCKDGKVLLIDENTDIEGTVKSSESVSLILALSIGNAIKGGKGKGTGENHARKNHTVALKTHDPDKLNVNEDKNKTFHNNQVYFDSFNVGVIDVADFRNCLNNEIKSDVDQSRIEKKNTIFQAAVIGHVIAEYYSFTDFGPFNNVSKGDFNTIHHAFGIERECEIITEMALEKGTKGVVKERLTLIDDSKAEGNELSVYTKLVKSKYFNKPFFYPVIQNENESGGTIIINQYFLVKDQRPFIQIICSAFIILDKLKIITQKDRNDDYTKKEENQF